MAHRDDLLTISKTIKSKRQNLNRSDRPASSPINFKIKNIQENAVDIFESTVEGVVVKSEPLCENDDIGDGSDCESADNGDGKLPSSSAGRQQNNFGKPLNRLRCTLCYRTFVGQKEIVKHLLTQHRLEEEAASDGQNTRYEADEEQDSADGTTPEQPRDDRPNDCFEPHIDYLCPQCGKEFSDRRLWRKHIAKVHNLTDMSVLNFKVISEEQVICLECSKIITNAYGVHNAQQHKFTHLPFKSYIRCRLCSKCYTDRKPLVKHLRSRHLPFRSYLCCHLCSKFYADRKGLAKHLRSRHRLGDDNVHHSASYSPSRSQEPPAQLPVQKEIVKHADCTFEIKYLNDEHENANESDILLDDDSPVPELNCTPFPSLKCKQCSLMFATQRELQTHITGEHEFLDFNKI